MYVYYSLIIKKMVTKKGNIKIYGHRSSVCPFCGRFIALRGLYTEYDAMRPINESFRNALGWMEYEKSGLCQECQDVIWGIEE